MPDSYLSTAAFAERYLMTQDRVVDLIHAGELRAVNISTNPRAKRPTWRIAAAECERFEQARSSVPPTPAPKRRRGKQTATVIEFY